MKVTILRAGYCTCPEHLAIQGGRWRGIHFPAMFALLEHERSGPMLFDTGYSQRFFEETRALPNRVYRWMTPVTLREADLAVSQLAARGIRPKDITRIFISHFHADHISALGDFPHASFVYLPSAFERLRGRTGLRAMAHAFMPGLLPPDFEARSQLVDISQPCSLPPEHAPFRRGYDLLGDETLLAVELPGHAWGQMGLLARDEQRPYFFVADAAWLMRSIAANRPPHALANLLFSDPSEYRGTLTGLHDYHRAHPGIAMIPSHCEDTLDEYAE
ncbi:MAG: MBL fold metallo-hydrolase [Anaerolineae bacterium]